MDTASQRNYVLITPAKNEESFIEKTLRSIIAQTLKPAKWVIVDDGSTDRTSEIVSSYLQSHKFIHLLKLQPSLARDFRKKVAAINAGVERLSDTPYSFIGNLDADISVAPEYYANIMAEFACEPRLGIAGGMVHTRTGKGFSSADATADSVGGCIQLFRRECFHEIGGFVPLPHGGEDAAAEVMARMHGWLVRKVPQNDVYEQRRTGTAANGVLRARYKDGIRFHSLGYGTIFFLCRCAYRLMDRPMVLGSILSLVGFVSAKLHGYPVCLPPNAVSYLRSEQNGKLRRTLSQLIRVPTSTLH